MNPTGIDMPKRRFRFKSGYKERTSASHTPAKKRRYGPGKAIASRIASVLHGGIGAVRAKKGRGEPQFLSGRRRSLVAFVNLMSVALVPNKGLTGFCFWTVGKGKRESFSVSGSFDLILSGVLGEGCAASVEEARRRSTDV